MGDDLSFKNESSIKNFEWHRERILREKKKENSCSSNRIDWNIKRIAEKHGEKAAREMIKELRSK